MVNGQITYLDATLDIDNSLPVLGCQDSTASNFQSYVKYIFIIWWRIK